MIGVTALAADTEAEAEFQAGAGSLSMLLLRSGRLQEIPTPEQAAAHSYSEAERDLIRAMRTTEVTVIRRVSRAPICVPTKIESPDGSSQRPVSTAERPMPSWRNTGITNRKPS